MSNKADGQKNAVRGLFASEEPIVEKKEKKPEKKSSPRKQAQSSKQPEQEQTDKPKFLKTRQATRGILHCEIGPELYERAALFAYDTVAPVKDLTDLIKKALAAYLDEEEPILEKVKKFQERARKDK